MLKKNLFKNNDLKKIQVHEKKTQPEEYDRFLQKDAGTITKPLSHAFIHSAQVWQLQN